MLEELPKGKRKAAEKKVESKRLSEPAPQRIWSYLVATTSFGTGAILSFILNFLILTVILGSLAVVSLLLLTRQIVSLSMQAQAIRPDLKRLINGRRRKDSKSGDSSASESKVKREVDARKVPGNESPKCFVSYTRESPAHESWVLTLATRLRENGVDVVLDKWDLKYGHDLAHFMETAVRESDFVILVCTPAYAKKANVGEGGAGYEKQIVTGEMFRNENPSKFIPLVRRGSNDEALPTFLKSRNYIDFRNDSDFESRLMDLLHQLLSVPKFPRPELGKSPFSKAGQTQQKNLSEPTARGTIPNLPPPLSMALDMPKVSEEPKSEDLQLRKAQIVDALHLRLHLENVGIGWITINRYAIGGLGTKALVPMKMIEAGESGAITIPADPSIKFEIGKYYDIMLWTDRGAKFSFGIELHDPGQPP